MPRVNIYFNQQVLDELREYIIKKYGPSRALSLTVQQAVREFLEREGRRGGDRNRNARKGLL